MPTTVGFSVSNTGTQVDWARVAKLLAAPFVVDSLSDLTPTAVTTADRTVRVGAGRGRLLGLLSTFSTAETVQVPVNNSGTVRVDAVVLRTVWAAALGQAAQTTQLVVVPGSGAGVPPTIATSGAVDAAVINRQPGVVYDAVVCFVETPSGGGALASTNVFDVRLAGGMAGPLQFVQAGYLTFVDVPLGARLEGSNGDRWRATAAGVQQVGTATPYASNPLNNGGSDYQILGSGTVATDYPNGRQLDASIEWTFTPTRTGPARLTSRFDLYAVSSGFTVGELIVTKGGASVSGWTDATTRDFIANWADTAIAHCPRDIQLVATVPITIGVRARSRAGGGQYAIASVTHVMQPLSGGQ